MSLVRKFHEAMEQEAPTYPSVPDARLASMRLRLIKEEMKEVDDEFQVLLRMTRSKATPDQITTVLQALVKELCDLIYVTEGTLVAFGCDDGPFEAVHRSNMSKLGHDGRPVKRADGKVTKGPNYKPVDPADMFPPIITIPEEDITECPMP